MVDKLKGNNFLQKPPPNTKRQQQWIVMATKKNHKQIFCPKENTIQHTLSKYRKQDQNF